MRAALAARTALRLASRALLLARRHRVEVVRFDSGALPCPPFRLPMRVTAVGETARSIASFITPYDGLAIDHVALPEHLRDQQCPQIVITSTTDLRRTLAAAHYAAHGLDGPALIVALGGKWGAWPSAGKVPHGAALYAVPAERAKQAIPRIVEHLVNDVPLERAVKDAARGTVRRSRGSLLVIDRAANYALRLAEAAEMVNVARERAGMPAVKTDLQLSTISAAMPTGLESRDVDAPRPNHGRVLDINIMRATYREGRPRMVPPGTTLQSDTDYFLVLHTGRRLATSIIREQDEGPPTDVVANAEPDVLDIVVQGKELTVSSTELRQVVVTPSGTSPTLFFAFRTPPRPGCATLRAMVYRQNEMLQSYLVSAEVTEHEVPLGTPQRGATAVLDFSQAEDLTPATPDETMLTPALTLAVNRSGSATHSISIKAGRGAAKISIPESAVVTHLREFREILLDASYRRDDDGPMRPLIWRNEPTEHSKRIVRRLADLGHRLYRNYLDDTDEQVALTLARIRDNNDLVISVVRFDRQFAFPWTVFYDWRPPRIPSLANVCFGESEPGVPCTHDYRSRVYCIRGFWGYRHQIEDLIGSRTPRKRMRQVARQGLPEDLAYLIGDGIRDPSAFEKVMKEFPDAMRLTTGDPGALIDTMWNRRPSLLVVLGHLRATPVDDEPSDPRIPLCHPNGRQWLLERDIFDAVSDHQPWSQPNSIVLLLTCESAATSPDQLSGFVTAFHRARAGAVIGTECLALTDCMERFAKRFLPMVWQEQLPLGKAMTQVRRDLLRQGYPLAFVFSCVGAADLKVTGPPGVHMHRPLMPHH
jgi:hypothetical protein